MSFCYDIVEDTKQKFYLVKNKRVNLKFFSFTEPRLDKCNKSIICTQKL